MYDIDDELMDDPRFLYIVTPTEGFESLEDKEAYEQYLFDAIKEAKNKNKK